MATLVLGSEAVWDDGHRGELRAVVIDPAAGTLTHLVVEPEGRRGLARLVPAGLADAAAGQLRLRCTEAEFQELDAAEQTLAEFALGYQFPVQLLPPGWRDAGGPTVAGGTIPRIPEKETIDVVPPGEVAEHRGGQVYASDGPIGELRAVRIDPASHQVTDLLVREGHALAHKEVAIPYGAVAGFDDGIRLRITRQQVRDLPRADADR